MEVRKLPHRTSVRRDKQNIYIEQQHMTPVPYLCYPSCSKVSLSVLRTQGGGTCADPSAIAMGWLPTQGLSVATGCWLSLGHSHSDINSSVIQLKTILSLKNRKKNPSHLKQELGASSFLSCPRAVGGSQDRNSVRLQRSLRRQHSIPVHPLLS